MIDGIVLAGGYSSRTNTNKMCLEYNGKALILNTIETMHQVCQKIIVVTGYHHNELLSLLKELDFVKIVYNEGLLQINGETRTSFFSDKLQEED